MQVSVLDDNTFRVTWTGIPGVTVYNVTVRNYSGEIAATVSTNYAFTDGTYFDILSGTIGT